MDIDALKTTLLVHFPDIINVHDFHVWQLTTSKVISTVHIIFQNPKVYETIKTDINQFFEEHGITQNNIFSSSTPADVAQESTSSVVLTSIKIDSNELPLRPVTSERINKVSAKIEKMINETDKKEPEIVPLENVDLKKSVEEKVLITKN